MNFERGKGIKESLDIGGIDPNDLIRFDRKTGKVEVTEIGRSIIGKDVMFHIDYRPRESKKYMRVHEINYSYDPFTFDPRPSLVEKNHSTGIERRFNIDTIKKIYIL